VNDRFIKSTYLNHAVMSAYERLLPDGAFPFYVLFLSIDPSHIDINVHPTKTEIKFDDERAIYAIVQAAIRKTLSINNLIPSLDFDTNVNFNLPRGGNTENNFGSRTSNFQGNSTSNKHSIQDAWKKLYEGLQDNINDFERQASHGGQDQLFSSQINNPENELPTLQSKANTWNTDGQKSSPFQVIQILNKYLAVTLSEGLLLIDQKRAYQRILYDQFIENLKRKNGASQQVLFPKILHISPADKSLLEEIKEDIGHLGFQLETDEENSYWVKGVPAGLGEEDGQNLIEGILEQVKNESSEFQQHRIEKIAQAMANRSAVKFQQKRLSQEELHSLVEQLFSSSNPNFSPNGETISRKLGESNLREIF
jgi:DNA mismatch repair protein MutL